MKLLFSSLLVTLMLIAFVGCDRQRYQVGNVDAPKKDDAPAYSVSPVEQADVQTH